MNANDLIKFKKILNKFSKRKSEDINNNQELFHQLKIINFHVLSNFFKFMKQK